MPIMGIMPEINLPAAKPRAGIANALFSATQQRVLGLLFEQPERSFYATEIIALAGSGSGAVQRELKRLAESGLVVITRVGNQKHYQADRASPIFEELKSIVDKTVGLSQPLRDVLSGFAAQIRVAFVYGPVAKRDHGQHGSMELVVIGHRMAYAEVVRELQSAEALVGLAIKLSLYTPQEWAGGTQGGDYVAGTEPRKKIFLIGTMDDLPEQTPVAPSVL
jgi:hypothetical protein